MGSKIFISTTKDPYSNLAFEEYLCRTCSNEQILFLWQNDKTVVIGRNQNAWSECSLSSMDKDGIRLARRTTGGGAVYHDEGNLNYSFIFPSSFQDKEKGYAVIMDALKMFGIDTIRSGRNDLTASDGRKFSGNAFRLKDGIFLHHGTLLINSDLSVMGRYLNPSFDKLHSKGITSVRSRVVNLSQLNESVTIEAMKIALIGAMNRLEPGSILETSTELPEVQKIRSHMADPIWLFEKNSKADLILSHRFSWGSIELCLEIREGKIHEVVVYTDALETELPEELKRDLNGCDFVPSGISKRITEKGKPYKQDIATWLETLSL